MLDPILKNAGLALTTGGGTAYTCPVGMAAKVVRIHVANVDGSASADATVSWTDFSNSATAYAICSTAPVAADDALDIGCLYHLEENDTITASASANGDLVLTLAIEEYPVGVTG